MGSFMETPCEDFSSIFRKEGREEKKRKGNQEEKKGVREKETKRGKEGGSVGFSYITGNRLSPKSLTWTKGTVAIWWQVT